MPLQQIFKRVPIKEEVIELLTEDIVCVTCKAPGKRIDKEFVRQEFRFTPAKGRLVKIYREIYTCPECSASDLLAACIQFVKAPVPEALILTDLLK